MSNVKKILMVWSVICLVMIGVFGSLLIRGDDDTVVNENSNGLARKTIRDNQEEELDDEHVVNDADEIRTDSVLKEASDMDKDSDVSADKDVTTDSNENEKDDADDSVDDNKEDMFYTKLNDEGIKNEVFTEIIFEDPAFEQAIKVLLNKGMDEKVYKEEVQNMTELGIYGNYVTATIEDVESFSYSHSGYDNHLMDFYAFGGDVVQERGNIKSLVDLKHFENLYNLELICQEIEDVSGLEGLPHLSFLVLTDNNIKDISALNDTSVKNLTFSFNKVDDLSSIPDLINNLETIVAIENKIGDIDAVKKANNIVEYDFENNPCMESEGV